MSRKKEASTYEGRDKAFMDIDRMINEGLGSGTVHGTHAGLIEKSRGEVENETPPNHTKQTE